MLIGWISEGTSHPRGPQAAAQTSSLRKVTELFQIGSNDALTGGEFVSTFLTGMSTLVVRASDELTVSETD